MRLIPVSELQQNLNFFPTSPWPDSMPCFAWQGELLCGFDRTQTEALQLDGGLVEILLRLYPTLKLSEMARLTGKLKTVVSDGELNAFLQHHGFKSAQRTLKFFESLHALPAPFASWCDEKNPGPNDMSILLNFQSFSPLNPVFDKIARENLSKSNGIMALELAGELILMNRQDDVLATIHEAAEDWLKSLKRLRFPLSETRKAKAESDLADIPWPKNTSAQIKTVGDQDMLEISIRASSFEDLTTRLNQLRQISENRQQQGQK